MYIKKRHKKNFLNILVSSSTLIWVSYFIVFAENYETENREHWVSADFLEIRENWNNWEVQFSNIIVWDFSDRFTYIVQSWESLSTIASRFWTTVDNIKTVNDLSSNVIREGQKLTISQEEWIIYQLEEQITLKEFTNKYSFDIDNIKSINYISDDDSVLEEWSELFIPISKSEAVDIWLVEREEQVVAQQQETQTQEQETQTQQTTSSWSSWEIINRRYYNPQVNNWFYAWHCTWYVADKLFEEHRPWWGNARDWYHNAQAAWYPVWQSPQEWAIVVIRYWAGYRTSYWHVAIVKSIDWEDNKILIEEMNYSWRFIVTQRRVPMDNRITWYIYY